MAGGLGVLEGGGEQAGEAGVGERVVVAAFGEQALASAGDDQDAVQIAVCELCLGVWRRSSCWVMWPISAMCALVARAGLCGSGSPTADHPRQSAASATASRSRGRCLEDAGELRLDDQ